MINCSYLRKVRQSRHYTLNQLSKETGYTASFLSQIERGLREPSLTSLRKISECLGVSLVSFFIQPEEQAVKELPEIYTVQGQDYGIVRRGEGLQLELPDLSIRCQMVTLPLIASDGQRLLRGFLYILPPGEWCSEKMISHSEDECIYCLQGKLRVCVGQDETFLDTGDCLYINAMTLHNFQNCGTEDCVQLTFTVSEKIAPEHGQ